MSGAEKTCYHCALPVPASAHYPVIIEGESHEMCCRGCQAVAQTIVDNGLTDYYRHRTALPGVGHEVVPEEVQKLALYDHPGIQKSFVRQEGEQVKEASLILEGITCAACIWLNERHLKQLPGVLQVQVNYATHRARITWNDQVIHLSKILEEIQLLGYNAHPYSAERQESLRRKRRAKDLRRIAIAGLSSGQVMMLAVALYAGAAFGMEDSTAALLRYFSLILTLPVVFYAALPFYQSAWNAVIGKRLNMDVPVTLAVIGAFVGSAWSTLQGHGVVYYDAITMFSLFLLSSRFLEHGAQEKSVEAAENLLKLAPAMATKVLDGGQHQPVPVLDLNEGDTILTKPGESIAADAEVIEGESTVDEALLTGESRPVPKRAGALVIAGSINLEGPLLLRVTGVGENTVLAGIVRLLDRAVAEKPRLAQLADRVAGHFTVGLLILTAIVGATWWWLEPGQAFGIMLAVLVVTCPCALSLAAPTAFAAAGSHLLRHGILLTRGHALETLAKVNHVVFDKTGTLTYGKPVLQRTVTFSDVGEDRCLLLAASLEQASEHPLAQSFLSRVAGTDLIAVQEAQNLPGNGVSGCIAGARYTLGNAALAGFEPVALPSDLPQGATLVWLCDERRAMAVFVLSDGLRPQARELVEQLQAAGVQVTILSGDAADAVAHVAAEAGIESWQAALRPEDKLKALRELQQRGHVVAMVGDGVNDAPVLAGADVSIAMGGGTQVARASSDIVLLTENLLDIQRALQTGHASIAVMRQNFAWAVVYNLLALPFAAVGMIPPWLASIGMSTSSLVVVLNALRLR
ncbi:ATPase P [Sulfuricella sp. T08]|uniref:heavy metal translocating P-type ATPase n=1 Tax=Sulfuricella sp. T08 TaxID=1632857 RepID=UPI00061795BD|nr:heavy metal translocating P-type ATPase [Sulfuricella sp. T08]GAO36588.1 ATPase P [Sulfuricella sp. T08]